MRIAMLQMDVAEGDKEKNIRHGFDLLEEAASSADVLVMPELWTIGYNFHDFKNRVTRVNDGLLDRLSSFAAYHHVTLEAGTLPIDIPRSDTLWALLTNGYSYSYISSLPDGHRDKTVLLLLAGARWLQIRGEAAA